MSNLLLLSSESSNVYEEAVSQSIVFSQAITFSQIATSATYSRTVNQSISFSQTISREVLYFSKTIFQTLTFSDTHYTKILNNQPVLIPSVSYTLVPKTIDPITDTPIKVLKSLKMQSSSGIVILPAPNYENAERNKGTVSVKRTMTGGKRVFIQPNDNYGLKYQFVITESKKKELLTFLRASNAKLITITDWKDNVWASYLMTNPVSANSVGNDRVEVSLEFEGMKLL